MSEKLWQEASSVKRLIAGWEKVRSNKGTAGGDGLTVHAYSKSSAKRLADLSARLRDGEFKPGPYRKLHIPKRSGGSRRLMIPSLEDRIIHTALAQVLVPILEPAFEDASFAYRPGRSVQQAVAAIEKWRREGYEHVIEADIVSYFDAVNHAKLLKALSRHLPDSADNKRLIEFIRDDLAHQGEALETEDRGLAQGSPLSPLLANLYLDHLDEEIHRRGVRIVRFADDFVILCKKRKSAEALLEETEELLKSLGLELNPAKTRLVDFDKGFEFLGYLFVRSLAIKREYDAIPTHCPKTPGLIAKEKTERHWDQDNTEKIVSADRLEEQTDKPDHDTGDRVLYVLERGRHLDLGSSAFTVFDRQGDELAMIGQHRVDRIEIGTGASLSENALQHCIANQLPLTFVNGFGAPRAELRQPETDNAALQLAQARSCLDAAFQTAISKALVDARIRNQRTQLFRLNRKPEKQEVEEALKRMQYHLRKLDGAETVDQLRGLEGAVAAEYWKALGILTKGAMVPFRRNRPADDPVNATINYLTWMLHRDIMSAVMTARLHPGFGLLHAVREYADALVYDLMEPFRAPLTEGLAAFLFNSRRLKPDIFEEENAGAVRILPPARSAIVSGYEQYVAKRIRHNGSSRKFGWRRVMLRQAHSLANAFRKDDPTLFQPYLMEA